MPALPESLPLLLDTFDELQRRAIAWFEREGIVPAARTLRRTVDMRYAGQNYELPVAFPDEPNGPALLKALTEGFERAHEQLYGYIAEEEPIQAITFRLEAVGAVRRAELTTHPPATADVTSARMDERDVWLVETRGFVTCPVYDRERLGPGHRVTGPAVVEQMDATTVLLPGQTAVVDACLNLIVEGP